MSNRKYALQRVNMLTLLQTTSHGTSTLQACKKVAKVATFCFLLRVRVYTPARLACARVYTIARATGTCLTLFHVMHKLEEVAHLPA